MIQYDIVRATRTKTTKKISTRILFFFFLYTSVRVRVTVVAAAAPPRQSAALLSRRVERFPARKTLSNYSHGRRPLDFLQTKRVKIRCFYRVCFFFSSGRC